MTSEIKLLIELLGIDIYFGYDNLKNQMTLHDYVAELSKNSVNDIVSSTIIIHQLTERMIHSLLLCNQYRILISVFPKEYQIVKKKNISFYESIQLAKSVKNFARKEELISLLLDLNKKRNSIAHRIIGIDFDSMIDEFKCITNIYNNIFEIIHDEEFKFYNYISKAKSQFGDNLISTNEEYFDDVKEIDDMFSIALKTNDDLYSNELISLYMIRKYLKKYIATGETKGSYLAFDIDFKELHKNDYDLYVLLTLASVNTTSEQRSTETDSIN